MARQQSPAQQSDGREGGEDAFWPLFFHHPTPTWLFDPSTQAALEVNDAVVRHYGYSRDECLGMTLEELRAPQGEGAAPVVAALGSGGSDDVRRERHRLKDGRLADVLVTPRSLVFRGQDATLLSVAMASAGDPAEVASPKTDDSRLLFELAPAALFVSDAQQRYVDANRAAVELLGYSMAELRDLTTADVIAPSERSQFITERERLGVEALAMSKWQFRRKDGSSHRCAVAGVALPEGRVLAILLDITECTRVEEALRESEARMRNVFDQASDGIYIISADNRYLDTNERGLEMLGYTRDELMGMSVADVLLPHEVPRLDLEPAQMMAGVPHLAEWMHACKDGSTFLGEVSARRLNEGAYLAIVRDLTESRLTKATLRQGEARLRMAVEASNTGLWDWDLCSNQVYYSPEWKAQIGYEDHEITDDFSEWRDRLHPTDLGRCLRTLEEFLADPGPRFELEFRFRHKNGTYRHVLARGSLLRDEQGQPSHLLGTHVDVTERTQLQAQFLQSQKMESVGRLAGGVAHDFNNLLTIINSSADLAAMDLHEGDPLRDDLEEIRKAGDRAARLTQQLLMFSRKQIVQPTILNLNTVLANIQNMLRRLISEDISLTCTLAADQDTVRADSGQIEQVLLNLVVNARDAMPGGGSLHIVTQDLDITETQEARPRFVAPGPYVLISVRDTGVGMDEEIQAQIFEPFFTTKEAGKGTGLGLSTVYGIVQSCGGSINVSSEVGKGTTFCVYLPRVEKSASQQDLAVRGVRASGGNETILVVEDEEGLRRLAARALRSAGYHVLTAANGGEALLMVERFDGPVDLMLTDIVMPGMNGRELSDRLRKVRPEMKVLFTSGYIEDAILHHGMIENLIDFISKPFGIADLKRKVREVLDRQE